LREGSRRHAGIFLQTQRKGRDLTQDEMKPEFDKKYPTMVSLIEHTAKTDFMAQEDQGRFCAKDPSPVLPQTGSPSSVNGQDVKLMASEKKLIKKIAIYKDELDKKDRILSSIYKINHVLNRSANTDQILKTILHESQKIFGFTRVLILLLNKGENKLETKCCIGFTSEEEKYAFLHPLDMDKHICLETLTAKTAKTIYIKDIKSYAKGMDSEIKMALRWKRVSNISAPLRINREVIGTIGGDRTQEEMNLSRSDIRLFTYFANMASMILENARLHEQNKKKMEQLIALQKISKKTSSTLEYVNLLAIVAENAKNLVHGSSCALMFLGGDGRYFRIAASKGYESVNVDLIKIPTARSICGSVAANGLPVLVEDTSLEQKYVAILPGIRSQLYAPLISNKRVMGVIRVDSDNKSVFSSEDLKILTVFANHVSTLIENVRLYEQIREERNMAQNILESAPNGILTIDKRKTLRMINRKAEEILKLKRRNVLEKDVSGFLHGMILTMLDDTVDHDTAYQYEEIVSPTKNGSPEIYSATSAILHGPQGNISGAIMTIQDLTEIKKTESMLRRTENLASLGQMSASIAHEIRNPLASINFNVQLLSKKLKDNPFVQPILTDTLEGIDRIKMVMKRTLDYTKVLNTSLAAGQIESVLADAISLVLPEMKNHHIEISKDIVGPVPAILFDSHQIQQVFVNLLLNAVEAMPRDGMITVAGKLEENIYSKGNDFFLIAIKDSGVGIPGENIKRIFDPFFTTKKEGTGLGLSIVHKILEQHGATIDVKSRENRGTVFYVRFPVMKRGA
jgi:two-component system NtrC family sensor kinase